MACHLLSTKHQAITGIKYGFFLPHYGLVAPYGETDLGQHWLRASCSKAPPTHQAITWTMLIDSKAFCDDYLRAISQEVFMNLIRNMGSEITHLKLLPHLAGANEWNEQSGRHL